MDLSQRPAVATAFAAINRGPALAWAAMPGATASEAATRAAAAIRTIIVRTRNAAFQGRVYAPFVVTLHL